ncbi:MAG: hypothetical protein LBM93_09410 [Oscillospiraceae bacterium]|jgi:hypothetical protein|nr:hypothetical protein [Oscillospiraceae bacterium]
MGNMICEQCGASVPNAPFCIKCNARQQIEKGCRSCKYYSKKSTDEKISWFKTEWCELRNIAVKISDNPDYDTKNYCTKYEKIR